jgi:hypothetical protein
MYVIKIREVNSLIQYYTTSEIKTQPKRDDFIEKLDKAHVDYDVREDKASVFGGKVAYVFSIKSADLKKVV